MLNTKKLTQLYAFISQVNQNIVRVNDERALFINACKMALEFGKFKIAWIGMFDEETKKINLIEQSGIPISDAALFTDVDGIMSTPQDYVLHTGKYYICNDLGDDPAFGSWKQFIARQGIYSCIVLPIKKSGVTVGSFNLYGEMNFVDKEEIALMVEVTNDISFGLDFFEKVKRQNEVEELLVFNEKRFRAMIENGRDMITLTNYEGEILYGSSTITNSFGYTREDFLNIKSLHFIHPDDIAEFVKKRTELLQKSGKSFYDQLRLRHKNGNWIWCELTLTNLLDEPGINALVSNFRDVSERKGIEKQKEFDRNNLTALINNTRDLMWSVDRNYKLITSNKPFDEVVKLMSDKAISKGDDILAAGFSPEQLIRYKLFYERAFAGESFTEEEYVRSPVEFWSEISFYPIRKGDQVVGTACHSRNVTERKLAELEQHKTNNDLIRRNKDLEQFSYIVSHDLRAPLANIIGALILLNDHDLSTSDKEILQQGLNKSAKNLDNVIKDLNHILGIRQPAKEKRERVTFSELVEGIKLSISNLLDNSDIEIICDFSKTDNCFTIKSYLYSIFYNLIYNSIKYRRQEVPLIIEIKSSHSENMVELSFSDNGMGINLEKNSQQVFGLYKRFHPGIKGKGMGLFMVKTQIETLGGKITVVSEVNKGTEFKLDLQQ